MITTRNQYDRNVDSFSERIDVSEKKSNPNNCRDCDFSTIRETGHCYMHEKKPDHVCKAHIKKQPTEEKMSFFTKALRFMAMRKK